MLNELLNHEMNDEIKTWVQTALKKHIEREPNSITLGEAEHMLDFLKSDAAPKRLRKASVEQIKRAAEMWNKSLQKHGKNIGETEEDTELVLELRNGLKLVKLVGQAAYKREGHLMSHCVASYYNKPNVEIYSLRDEKNMPHCTIELRRSKNAKGIEQIKGKGNGSIHPKYIDAVLESLNHFGLKVRTSELSYLGYAQVSDELMRFIKENFKDIKTLSYQGEVYLFKHQEFIERNLDT